MNMLGILLLVLFSILESVFSLPGYYYGPPSNPFEYGGYGRRPSVPRTATVEFQSAGDSGVTGHVTLQEVRV